MNIKYSHHAQYDDVKTIVDGRHFEHVFSASRYPISIKIGMQTRRLVRRIVI